ncbi:carboxypeptidase-like regulatory domain-containing protein [Hymenobacter sp. ISL-91]|uniref:carboxypeptidase-like regulatory domain-containing protein n=1 Tax=Hymenobacter sp. ISL-91 TaxID=2819151 RepID=UPI001BE9DF31|nr:carboxypeptidase-like regulatory domain-containing protein [Hymenobacter sp. ISL-91]MBT2559549.1 carboxypeptidase-like regulatory domain-containing protein [Hymenobacter sp. ISL-91]
MDNSTPTTPEIKPENEDFSPDMTHDEEELSSGNSRLALIAGGIVAAVLAGYLLLPATITNPGGAPELPTPTMMLGEASITGTRTPDETAPADAATAAGPAETAKPATATAATAATARTAAAARNAAAAPAAAPKADEPEEVALAPVVPATPVAVAEPAELAPTSLKLNGRVLDENGRPLAGATILLKGSKVATSTDANGNYALEVPAGTDNTLLYGYGGYQDQVLRSRNTKTQNVTLVPREDVKRRRR